MAHHAYFVTGESEQGIERALAHAKNELGLTRENNPDLVVLRHGLFSVDDARKLADMTNRAAMNGSQKAIVVSALRLFHEAQNAMLKIFEEPSPGTTLILVIPAEGMLLPTLRSRLLPLPSATIAEDGIEQTSPEVQAFLKASSPEREKLVAKLLDRAKSDTDTVKQGARNEAVLLVEGLIEASYAKREVAKDAVEQEELMAFLSDLDAFLPILHERSAPLKLIFEHILLVIPKDL
ncbi:MAG: polymerase subunit delta, polymerase subunit delta protein [Parcubacteria group bacterium]|nr:polymerase subunit delta, polymerase subunit delta protein [Parcubacteria group bacterium]